MEEVWRSIKGYEGLYEISNLGRVKSLHWYGGNTEKIMTCVKRPDNYLKTTLSKNGKVMNKLIHRLVAETFLPNPDNLEMVNHKDENKSNNNVDNLEWCSRSYNAKYSLDRHEELRHKMFLNLCDENGKVKRAKTYIKPQNNIPVNQYDLDGIFIAQHPNSVEARISVDGKRNNGNILNCCRNKSKTAHGYKWQFAV